MDWRLGKITGVKGTQVWVTYSLRGAKAKAPLMHTIQRSARDVSIIYSEDSCEKYLSNIFCED